MATIENQPQRCKRLLMLGVDHQDYGSWSQQTLGQATVTLSVGADQNSPSLAAKGDRKRANEDGALVLAEGDRYLLAVADGHFGNTTSHTLLKRLSRANIPLDRAELKQLLTEIQEPEKLSGAGSTLTVAVFDVSTRLGFGSAIGDSTLAAVSQSGYRQVCEGNDHFYYFNNPLPLVEWEHFEFHLEPGEVLLLFSDGVNECCYRQPDRSILPSHIHALWGFHHAQPQEFAGQLTKLALLGVSGNPGGQDNIALLVVSPHLTPEPDRN